MKHIDLQISFEKVTRMLELAKGYKYPATDIARLEAKRQQLEIDLKEAKAQWEAA